MTRYKVSVYLRNTFLVFCAFSLFFVQSCATAPRTDERGAKEVKPLEVTSVLRFPDLPAPEGFKLLVNESFVFENEYVRFGLLKYVGRPAADRVVKFYKEEMPSYGWSPINVIEYGTRLLNFEKPNQNCVITVAASATSTSIIIAVTPKKRLDKE